jgi:hypothetical protein
VKGFCFTASVFPCRYCAKNSPFPQLIFCYRRYIILAIDNAVNWIQHFCLCVCLWTECNTSVCVCLCELNTPLLSLCVPVNWMQHFCFCVSLWTEYTTSVCVCPCELNWNCGWAAPNDSVWEVFKWEASGISRVPTVSNKRSSEEMLLICKSRASFKGFAMYSPLGTSYYSVVQVPRFLL